MYASRNDTVQGEKLTVSIFTWLWCTSWEDRCIAHPICFALDTFHQCASTFLTIVIHPTQSRGSVARIRLMHVVSPTQRDIIIKEVTDYDSHFEY